MTVINMMSFGDSGAAVADEQSSGGMRKYNVAMKLKLLDNSVIYGGSGTAHGIKEVYDMTQQQLTQEKKKREVEDSKEVLGPSVVHNFASRVLSYHKNNKADKFLNDNFGFSHEELQTGKLKNGSPIDEQLKPRALDALNQFYSNLSVQLLIGGLENKRFELYYTDNQGNIAEKMPMPFSSIGSGSDESDKVLSRYITELPRDKRENIPVGEGLIKLIEATNASARLNVGVGGIPSIVYVHKNSSVFQPGENESILASEIVEGYTRGLLEKKFTQDCIMALVTEQMGYELAEKQMKNMAKDWDKLDRILRGYKE